MIIIAVFSVGLSIVSGGIFTIILVPIAILALISAGASLFGARKAGVKAATHGDAGVSETVTRFGDVESESGEGRVPATPDELLKARRAAN